MLFRRLDILSHGRDTRDTGMRVVSRASRPCLIVFALIGAIAPGCQSQQEKIADKAVADYFIGDYAKSARELEPLAKETNENFVLNNLRLGSAALARHDYDNAEAAFLNAYEVINSTGVNDGGRSLGAVLVAEKIKVWKGEPYERAMANLYLGIIYYIRQDYANARGAFENALFKLRDYAEDEKKAKKDDYRDVESNFGVAAVMLGKCWQKLDREDLARANFQRALEARGGLDAIADYDRNAKANLCIIVESGRSPEKVTDFDGSIVGFSPKPNMVPPPPLARVRVDGQIVTTPQLGRPTMDTVVMAADRRWQSIDTINAVKSGIGTGLLAAGAIEGIRGATERGSAQRRDLIAGAALAGAGLLLKATSQADIRQWEALPRSVYVMPLHVTPGTHDIVIDFPASQGLHQEWRGITVPESGEATYFFRMRRYDTRPHEWPPPALQQADGSADTRSIQ